MWTHGTHGKKAALPTLVMRPCMMRKCGLLTLSCTEWKRFCTWEACTAAPLIRYLFFPPTTTCRGRTVHIDRNRRGQRRVDEWIDGWIKRGDR